jgi:hypothetical protein
MSDTLNAVTSFIKKSVEAPMNIGTTALDTAEKTTENVGETITGVTENVGKTATSATGVVSNAVETLEEVSKRIKDSTAHMAIRRAQIEESKTRDRIGKTKTEIAQLEKDTNETLLKIEQEYEVNKNRMEKEQELLMERIAANYDTVKMEQTENEQIMYTCYDYGFKTDSPPYTPGVNKTSLYYSSDKVWYYSYVPVTFVTNSGRLFELDLPKKENREERNKKLVVADKSTGSVIIIHFDIVLETGYLWNSQNIQPVIEFTIDNGETKREYGRIYFNKTWFFKRRDVFGGKKKKSRTRKIRRRKSKKTYSRNKRRSLRYRTRRNKSKTNRRVR